MIEAKCKYCNKIFQGINQEHANSQLSIHLISKHKDKVEIKEIKKEIKK